MSQRSGRTSDPARVAARDGAVPDRRDRKPREAPEARARSGSGFSFRVFIAYNALVVVALTLVTGLVRGLEDLWALAVIFAIISVTISAIMELSVPHVDRLAARRGPRFHLLLLNVLYLVGGAAGFALARWT